MTTYAMKIASSIVTAHLASNKMPAEEIPAFLGTVFEKVVALDHTALQAIPAVQPTAPREQAPASSAQELRIPTAAVTSTRGIKFDADKWLASLPEANQFTESEARRENEYLGKGWVGVYDSHIVCLLDGKSVRVLTAHLKRHYKGDPRASSAEAYRAHFRLPPDYPMGAPEFHELKSRVIAESHAKGRQVRTKRDDATQKRINDAIVAAGMDPAQQVNAQKMPAVFQNAIVCVECAAKVGNLAHHLADAHPQLTLAMYLKGIKASSKYPNEPELPLVPEHTFDDTLNVCANLLEQNDRSANRQVNGQEWPGVFERFITCLEDGKEVADLRAHIAREYGMDEKEYIARWKLPANYPFTAPAIGAIAQPQVSAEAAPVDVPPAIAQAVAKRVRARKEGRISLFPAN